jgi:hypothetical protein
MKMSDIEALEAAARLEEKKAATLKTWQSIVLVLILAGIFLALYVGLYQADGRFLNSLRETDVSRGLITFVVAVTTVSIALVLAVYVMASNEKADVLKERFSYAKDVLATLVGILGTILGFYFGTTVSAQSEGIQIAEPQVRGTQLLVHVAGGVPPYRYTVILPGLEQSKTVSKVSKDGWIFEQLPSNLNKNDSISVEVSDSKDKKSSRSIKFSPENQSSSENVKPASGAPVQGGAAPIPAAPAASK